ncbi:helix-turn-helix transcriptional regulator [Shewanella psychrotolerans]|uniref:helix-turn-helix transcriptional regulator n=1 Tax=Shewanella psychrotolerans TaxID=2864206 RepID=UPI001C656D3A|nr:AlpA family phage regulatory protein [Shewanella psychrotolerans]QYK02411.1 AlpA family phage regulatory protein [Shewanella psychrotolerans]
MSEVKRIVRKNEAKLMLGISKSTLHERINAGLIPPPFRLSGRAVGWFEDEIQHILLALAAGQTDSELTLIVKKLTLQRKEVWASLRL